MRNLVLIVLLSAAAAVSWYFSRPIVERPPPSAGAGQPAPGYSLYGAQLLGTDETGQVAYRMAAERLEELPERDALLLHDVQVEYRPPEGTHWSIKAATATAPKSRVHIDFEGGVELTSETGGDGAVHIATQALRFDPSTASVESTAPVEMTIGDWRLAAQGLRTHLKGDRLELESDVHGTLVP